MYNKEKDFYYNISYAQIKNLYWNSDLIVGYVANNEINSNNNNNNNNNGNEDKNLMIICLEAIKEKEMSSTNTINF